MISLERGDVDGIEVEIMPERAELLVDDRLEMTGRLISIDRTGVGGLILEVA